MEILKPTLKKLLEKQHNAFAGNHTAVKICTWTKKSLLDEGVCYKEKFYGINCHRCCQMSPAMGFCNNRCVICWRPVEFTVGNDMNFEGLDKPKEMVRNCIKMQRKQLAGFGGNMKTNLKKYEESKKPLHFAISLSGEPTLYPKLDELIKEVHRNKMTTFVVTNGQCPEVLEKIEPPTQLYLSIDAPNEKLFREIDRPTQKDGWEKLVKSAGILKDLKQKTRTALRITLVKEKNMAHEKEYAEIIKKAEPHFVEVKAYMFVGASRQRLTIKNMPRHHEVRAFAQTICRHSGYKIIDEQPESRVVLLMEEDFPGRIMKF